ncbi:hypothetical protein DFAR_2640003 [Desulfarculales bacterium]
MLPEPPAEQFYPVRQEKETHTNFSFLCGPG